MLQTIQQNLQLNLNEEQNQQLNQLVELYSEWNSQINLSAIKTEKDIWIKHIFDSLLGIQTKLFEQETLEIADLGTGGGYPLLPLSITYPQHNFTGIDSVQKKIKVIQTIAQDLNLSNVQTHADRVETVGQSPQYREKFDLVTTRAFAKWHTLLELSLPLVKIGGKLLAYQGPQITDEIEASEKTIEKLGGRLEILSEYELPENTGERIFVIIKKIKTTPKQFPRAVGIPKKKPLLISR